MSVPRHRSARPRHGRLRLLVVLVAPLAVLTSLAAVAAVATHGSSARAVSVRYTKTWSPPLDLPSNYQPCCPSKAAFTTLPFSMNVLGSQEAVLTIVARTNWVDTKARTYTPNFIQQGRYVGPTEIKISVHSGPAPADHRAQCRIAGAGGGIVNAQGPSAVDVADGRWHTITCIKYPDGPSSTSVQVTVDGVAGPLTHSGKVIGSMVNADPVDLGGQGPVANKDSIDGEYTSVTYSVG
jgi:hypothetical protein